MIARLGPVESRLAAFEAALAAADPQGALDRFAERLEGVAARMTALEGAGKSATEISERLADLYRQKDAAIEALVGRLAPLEARLAELDPQGALDRFAERLEAVQAPGGADRGGGEPGGGDHRAARRAPRPEGRRRRGADARLAPMEARLAEIDPQGALDRFAERLEAVAGAGGADRGGGEPGGGDHRTARRAPRPEGRRRRGAGGAAGAAGGAARRARPAGGARPLRRAAGGGAGRVAPIEGAENPVAEITERLAELHAQKDVGVEALVQRLAPMEARLAELDPQGALDRFAERLEAVQARVALIEGAENPVAEITERLAELHAQKDVAVEALVERLAPLEARLAEIEGGVARVLPLAEDDPRAALAALKARLESLDHAQEAVAVGLEALRAGLARTAAEEAGAEGRAAGARRARRRAPRRRSPRSSRG